MQPGIKIVPCAGFLPSLTSPSLPGFSVVTNKINNLAFIFVLGLALEGTQTKTEMGLELGNNILYGKTLFNIMH